MDIHYKQLVYKKGLIEPNAELVFFRTKDLINYEPKYMDIVSNSKVFTESYELTEYYFTDDDGIDYRIKKWLIIEQVSEDDTIIYDIKASNKLGLKLLFRTELIKFLNNHFPDMKDKYPNDQFIFDNIINTSFFNIKSRIVTKSRNIWNMRRVLTNIRPDSEINIALLIIDNDVIGRVFTELIDDVDAKDFFRNKLIMLPSMNLYISRVDIRPDYQGNGLCKPLLKYTIEILKSIGYKMLFIENASKTRNGVPACICYITAGIENGYSTHVKDKESEKFREITKNDCLNGYTKDTYNYIIE